MHRPCRTIAICAPATPITRTDADAVLALAAAEFPDIELRFHPQCFSSHGHFAGRDAERLEALLESANDPSVDAVWFAKGGYGSNRIAREAMARISSEAAARKYFLGYSDTGTLLGALYRAGIGQPVHAPMPVDIRREGGADAVRRTLDWLDGGNNGLEPHIAGAPAVAFNLMTLAMLCGTSLMPNLAGHVVMVEEVAEHDYATDRLLFHVTEHLRGIAGLRLGEVLAVPENDRAFGATAEESVEFWCERSGIEYLGRAEIGHCSANRIVPFGLEALPPRV